MLLWAERKRLALGICARSVALSPWYSIVLNTTASGCCDRPGRADAIVNCFLSKEVWMTNFWVFKMNHREALKGPQILAFLVTYPLYRAHVRICRSNSKPACWLLDNRHGAWAVPQWLRYLSCLWKAGAEIASQTLNGSLVCFGHGDECDSILYALPMKCPAGSLTWKQCSVACRDLKEFCAGHLSGSFMCFPLGLWWHWTCPPKNRGLWNTSCKQLAS